MRSPFSAFFGGAARQSMEPLLAKEGKEDVSRSGSPIARSPGAGARASAILSTLLLRRRQVLVLIVFVVCFSSLLVGSRKLAKRVADRQHIFDLTVRVTREPFVEVPEPQKLFAWSSEPFLPPAESPIAYLNGSLAEFRGHQRNAPPAKEHTLSLYPAVQDLHSLPDNVRPEEIVFGFASPYHRARDMCRTWRHFLKHGSQCLLVLPPEEYMYLRDMQFYLEKEELGRCHVVVADLGKFTRYEHRVMNMPRQMQQEEFLDSSGNKIIPKWFVVQDDDSQILDMRVLQREMSLRRHDEDHMLCALTESATQIGRHGKICYGGGGIFLSAAFAKKMSDHMDECFWWHAWRFGGDEMLTHCASTSTANATGSIPPDQVFEVVDGLHQIDISGDATGLLQSGLSFITLHHWLGWVDLFPYWSSKDKREGLSRLQKAADFLGGDNLFKRFVFDDGSTLLTLGYSITLFSQPMKSYELQLIERTHRHWEHLLRWPSRPAIEEGKRPKGRYKTTYYIKEVLPEDGLFIFQNEHQDIIRLQYQK